MSNEYNDQAEKFLTNTSTTFTVKFLFNGPYFDGDKDNRDVYEITLKRKKIEWAFKFGQSIAHSKPTEAELNRAYNQDGGYGTAYKAVVKRKRIPTAYDVLAALTKHDPGTFTDFCGEYGYDTDSRKAEKTYFTVQDEYSNVRRMFGDVLERLAEIS